MKNTWLNRRITDPLHADDLEAASAVHEFRHGLRQQDAEDKAYEDYVVRHAKANAAHHYLGAKAAHHSGNEEAAMEHGKRYAAAMKHLGYDPNNPPKDVLDHIEGLKDKLYSFKSHEADDFFEPEEVASDDSDLKLKDVLARVAAIKKLLG